MVPTRVLFVVCLCATASAWLSSRRGPESASEQFGPTAREREPSGERARVSYAPIIPPSLERACGPIPAYSPRGPKAPGSDDAEHLLVVEAQLSDPQRSTTP